MHLDFNRALFALVALVVLIAAAFQLWHHDYNLVIISVGVVIAVLMPEFKGLK